jgi:integrase/recombinase XerC
MTTGPKDVETARVLLAALGVTAADLLDGGDPVTRVPTFAAYVPVVSDGVSAATRRVYSPYWNYVVRAWGSRRIDEPTPSEVKSLAEYVRTHTVRRRNGRDGRSAVEHFIAALRCLYKQSHDDELLPLSINPAGKVQKPPRLPSTHQALSNPQLAELNHIAATTGNDSELDSLLVRLHSETACRRGGALNLRPQDLSPEQCLVYIREKGGTVRWQPVSPTLMTHLLAHRDERHATQADQQLLRYTSGRPIGTRRYDHLWLRAGEHLPWARSLGITTHWLRHTTLTWVERNFGYAVARAYAGHADRTNDVRSTATYVKATIQEVAAALATLTGEPHPLASNTPPPFILDGSR